MLAKHRSLWDSLTSKIKDALHHIFPTLPPINTNSVPSEVEKWKSNPIVARCHKILFHKEKDGDSSTYMTKIIDKIWPTKKNAPKVHIAYAISVCEFLLNPSHKRIQVSEAPIKFQISKYLQRVLNKEKMISSDEDDNNGAESSEITERDDEKEIQSQDQEGNQDQEWDEIIQDEEDGKDLEKIENDSYHSSEDERLRIESLSKKYKRK